MTNIRQGLRDSELLRNFGDQQVNEIVDVMFPKSFAAGECIIREGEPGNELYVIEEGCCEVLQKVHFMHF